MTERVGISSKKDDPKLQPVRRPVSQDPTPKSERKLPPRDTRDAPAPNPNGVPVDTGYGDPKDDRTTVGD